MKNQSILMLYVIVATVGLLGVVAIEAIEMSHQEAEASRGCVNANVPGGGSMAFNASKGRCAR